MTGRAVAAQVGEFRRRRCVDEVKAGEVRTRIVGEFAVVAETERLQAPVEPPRRRPSARWVGAVVALNPKTGQILAMYLGLTAGLAAVASPRVRTRYDEFSDSNTSPEIASRTERAFSRAAATEPITVDGLPTSPRSARTSSVGVDTSV